MVQKIKVIVVDDELEAREGIKMLLEVDADISLVSVCKNGIEAIEALTNFKIDLMFLDIQMPMVDGFEVVRSTPQDRIPSIIFTTAYDQYAVKAFEVHAIDYLLKPFSDDRFYDSLKRAKAMIHQQKQEEDIIKMRTFADNIHSGKVHENLILESSDKLVVKEGGKVHFLSLNEVIWIEAFDYYVKIHVKDKFFTVRDSLKRLIDHLPTKSFSRIHKSSIINMGHVDSIETLGNGEYQVVLDTGKSLKVSRSYKDTIRHLIKN